MASTLLFVITLGALAAAMPPSWPQSTAKKGVENVEQRHAHEVERRLANENKLDDLVLGSVADDEETDMENIRVRRVNQPLLSPTLRPLGPPLSYQMISAPSSELAFEAIPSEWKLALVRHLMAMRDNGHDIQEIEATRSSLEKKGENVVCKVSPYRVCYRLTNDGILRPLQRTAQPINTLRVY